MTTKNRSGNRGATVSVLALAGLLALAAESSAWAAGRAAAAGSELFTDTHKCNTCHSVAAAGIESKAKSERMKGPDLSGYRAPSGFDVAGYLRKKATRDGEPHKQEFKGTDEELQAILDWLGSLEAAKR